MEELRKILSKEVLSRVPRILGLLDRNRFSNTYGCFDRYYWHYGVKLFPSTVVNMNCLALALLYTTDFEDNKYFLNEKIREYAEAGVRYLCKVQLKDGSQQEYFPKDRDVGATVFTLIAMVETCELLGIDDEYVKDKILKQALFLNKFQEIGIVSNHRMATAYALYITGEYLRLPFLCVKGKNKMDLVIDSMYGEGWFTERLGCDLGYNTFTLSYLTELYERIDRYRLKEVYDKIISFHYYTIQPSGCNGGLISARKTAHFFPLGFLYKINDKTKTILSLFKQGLINREVEAMDDDYYFVYNLVNYLKCIPKLGNIKLNNNYRGLFFKNYLMAGIKVSSSIIDGKHCFNISSGDHFKRYDCGDIVLATKEAYRYKPKLGLSKGIFFYLILKLFGDSQKVIKLIRKIIISSIMGDKRNIFVPTSKYYDDTVIK